MVLGKSSQCLNSDPFLQSTLSFFPLIPKRGYCIIDLAGLELTKILLPLSYCAQPCSVFKCECFVSIFL